MNEENIERKKTPYSENAERAVLGAIFLDSSAITKVADVLTAEDFYIPANSKIYEVMTGLMNRGKAIDYLIVANGLESMGILNKMVEPKYLLELAQATPTALNIFEYAKILKAKSILRNLIRVGQDISALGFKNDESQNLLDQAEQKLFSVTQNLIKDRFVHIKEIVSNTWDRIAEIKENREKGITVGVNSGFESLDKLLNGFKETEMIVLAARPSMGKTAFAINIAQNIAMNNDGNIKKRNVGILSLEMSKEQLVERMFCGMLGVDSWVMNSGKLEEKHFEEMGKNIDDLSSSGIYIDDSVDSSITEVRAKARRLQMEKGLDLLVIDYLQLMTSGGKSFYNRNRVQEISEISRSLKSLARELRIPIIALSQLSRGVENRTDKIPLLSDLRESGAIEQDADVVMMMFRDDYYNEDSDQKGVTNIFIRKNRNGPTGKIDLMFKKEQMKFVSITKRDDDYSDYDDYGDETDF